MRSKLKCVYNFISFITVKRVTRSNDYLISLIILIENISLNGSDYSYLRILERAPFRGRAFSITNIRPDGIWTDDTHVFGAQKYNLYSGINSVSPVSL